MPLDPYASCPCGSGKKFKWCCQPIHVQIDRAFRQDAEGQHETALRLMDEVLKEHPANPEGWGRKAQLLYQNDRVEDAENALQKAFEINPNYPFGHLLRGMFRYHEGEIPGSLLLFRKAAEVYDPEARDQLGQVYSMIGECELKFNRPVAARAAFQIALHCRPAEEELRRGVEQIFGSQSRLPLSARQEYKFQSPAGGVTGARRAAWDKALAGASSTRLSAAARAFEQLTNEDAADAAAWYNLGVARAWLGDNRGALEALERYVALEPDAAHAGSAWALGEVLRCGHGMEEQADYLEHSATFQVRDPQALIGVLEDLDRNRRLLGAQVRQEEGVLSALVMDAQGASAVIVGGTPPPQTARLGAYLFLAGDVLRLWNANKESLDRTAGEFAQRVGAGLVEIRRSTGPIHFTDAIAEALVFPIGVTDQADAERRVVEHAQRYFEETWVHKPLRSLNQVPPIDAAGHAVLRKKLLGVIEFLQECATGGVVQKYDFDRLRRKLGLTEAPAEAAPVEAAAAGPDIGAMGTGELAALKADTLGDEQLEQAYQTAVKLDAHDLASHFAHALVARPPHADRADRFPLYSYLTQRALAEGNTDEALNCVNEGERVDCERNEGRRRNDYELRRAQVHVKRGEMNEAKEVYERLIERVPGNLRYRGSATEGMLSLKQPAQALRFAEQGLAKAREQNDRDSEQYFLELVSAAKKQGA